MDYHHHHHHRIFYNNLLSEVLCAKFLINAGNGESTETRIGTTYDKCSKYDWNWDTKIIIRFYVLEPANVVKKGKRLVDKRIRNLSKKNICF